MLSLTLLTCYAPTEDTDKKEKGVFYDQLQSAIDDTPSHDVLLVIGDLNARTGSVNIDRERVLSKEVFGTIDNNGETLLEICQENNLVIRGSLFQHKDIHKITWKSPDGRAVSQIDHIIINQKWRRSLQTPKLRDEVMWVTITP